MSAYASLPGSFLPPFFSFGGGASNEEKEEEDNNEKLVVENTPQVQPSNNISTPPCSPSTHKKPSSLNNISPSAFKALALSSAEIDNCNTTDLSQNRPNTINTDTTCAPSSSSSSTTQPSDIIIAIRSARVDPVTLIKSLTSKGSNIARRTANFMSGASSSGDTSQNNNSLAEKKKGKAADDNTTEEVVEEEEVSIFSRPGLCYDTDSDEEYSFYDYSEDFSTPNNDNDVEDYVYGDTNHSSTDDSKSCGINSDNGDDPSAIEFELSITFQGRKYNATRAFPTFVKLREDLQKEMNNNNDRQHRSRRNCSSVSRSKSPQLDSDCTDTAAVHNTEKDDEGSVSVPELPRVSPENLGHGGYALSGVARSGFALLQATAQHYCPEMENWLASVVQAFPCSQVLSSFLWEPLSSTTAQWETIGEEVDKSVDNETTTPLNDTLSSSCKPPLHNNRSKTKTSGQLQRKTHSSCGSLSSIQESPQEDESPEYYGDDW